MQPEAGPDFHFLATGIGSVPFLDSNETCRRILHACPEMPYWPQLVNRTHLENMIIQFSEGLPLLKVQGNTLLLADGPMEEALVSFYERFLADDIESFAISPDHAPGLYDMTGLIMHSPEKGGFYIKGQTVGPVTFAAAVKNREGKTLFNFPDLLDACTKGLAARALWQVKALSKTGKKPVLLLDEPYLTGFGSAFTPVQPEAVVALIREVIDYVKQRSDALVGIHCCGNTDWPMITEAGPDIISFDAFSHMEHFLLFPKEISRFLEQGGAVAWGIVPTFGFTGSETVEGLFAMLREGLKRLCGWGLDPEEVAGRSLLTPACGVGTIEPLAAAKAHEMLLPLSRMCRENLGAGNP